MYKIHHAVLSNALTGFMPFIDFNKRYRAEYPHMVITYVVRDEHGRKEHQAAWQMSNVTYKKWRNAIKQVQGRYPPSEFG